MEIKKSIDQLPGALSIWAIPLSNIDILTDNIIRVKDINNVVKIKPSAESGHHIAPRRSSRAGKYFEHQVTFFIQGKANEPNTLLQKTEKYKLFITLLQNENGAWQRIGDKHEPCTITGEFSTQRPGYEFIISANTTHIYNPAPYNINTLTPILTAPPQTPIPPSPN